MGKPSPPAPPDPRVTIPAQTSSNLETASGQSYLNSVNSQTPFGSVSYDVTGQQPIYDANGRLAGNVPRWTQTTTLSPEQQALYNSTTGLEQQALNTAGQGFTNAQGTLSQPFTLNGLPNLQTGVNSGPLATGYNAVNPTMAPESSGPIQTSLGNAGPLQSSVPTSGQQTSLNNSNLPNIPGLNDFSAERQRVEDAYLGRFNTDIANQQNDLESRLNAEGLQRGSTAWNNAQDALNRERVDARNAAIQAGGAEQQRLFNQALGARQQQFGENLTGGQFTNQALSNLFGQNLAAGQFGNQAQQQLYNQLLGSGQFANAAQGQQFGQNETLADFYNQAAQQQTANNQGQAAFGNTAEQQAYQQALANANLGNAARQQSISEQQLLRSQPINELATLLGLGSQIQVPNAAPNFNTQINPTDVLGAYGLQYQGQMNNYNQQMQARNALFGGLSNLGGSLGAAAILSDARHKRVIRKIGETSRKIPLYLFNYIGSNVPQIGVLAQEVRGIIPNAVKDHDGVLYVDYAQVT